MSQAFQIPAPGSYKRAQNVRLVQRNEQFIAICDYPLRAVRLNQSTARLLALCETEQTCTQLAQALRLSSKRVEKLCEQLCQKNLLSCGPLLPPARWPNVSVIVPCYNRAQELIRCLQSIFEQDYPAAHLEVIIVDDGSTDGTAQLLEQVVFERQNVRRVRHETRQGVAASRNSGAATAQYELLAYLDSDCVAAPNWLMALVPAFQRQEIGAVGGVIRAYERDSLLGRYEDVRSSLYMGERLQQVTLDGPLTYLPTANLLIRRDLWQQLGGFASLAQGEDVDFCRRLLKSGATIHYLPQGVVYHDYRTTLPAFLRIRTAYASSEASLLQLHPSERRVLLLPPEQATFTAFVLGGLWALLGGEALSRFVGTSSSASASRFIARDHLRGREQIWITADKSRGGRARAGPYNDLSGLFALLSFVGALLVTLFGTYTRWQRIHRQDIPINPITVGKATLRAHLAYTYHFCRHITRYYLLLLLTVGLLIPPLLLVPWSLHSIVTIVDYLRLKPKMQYLEYAWCALFDDCAYEIGLVQGCVKQRTWKPLVPVIRKRLSRHE